jgi:hypothetical protein
MNDEFIIEIYPYFVLMTYRKSHPERSEGSRWTQNFAGIPGFIHSDSSLRSE